MLAWGLATLQPSVSESWSSAFFTTLDRQVQAAIGPVSAGSPVAEPTTTAAGRTAPAGPRAAVSSAAIPASYGASSSHFSLPMTRKEGQELAHLLSNCLWAGGSLQLRPSSPWALRMASHCHVLLPICNSWEVSVMLWGLMAMHQPPPVAIVADMVAAVGQRMASAEPEHLVRTLYCMACMGAQVQRRTHGQGQAGQNAAPRGTSGSRSDANGIGATRGGSGSGAAVLAAVPHHSHSSTAEAGLPRPAPVWRLPGQASPVAPGQATALSGVPASAAPVLLKPLRVTAPAALVQSPTSGAAPSVGSASEHMDHALASQPVVASHQANGSLAVSALTRPQLFARPVDQRGGQPQLLPHEPISGPGLGAMPQPQSQVHAQPQRLALPHVWVTRFFQQTHLQLFEFQGLSAPLCLWALARLKVSSAMEVLRPRGCCGICSSIRSSSVHRARSSCAADACFVCEIALVCLNEFRA